MAGFGFTNLTQVADFLESESPAKRIPRRVTERLRLMDIMYPMIYDALSGIRADTANYPNADIHVDVTAILAGAFKD